MKLSLIFKPLLAITAALLIAHPAQAGTQTGVVTELMARASDGVISFKLSNTAGPTRPSCASLTTYWIIKDEKPEAGKRQLALLMMARAGNLTVTVVGSAACTRWPDGEDANTLIIQ